MQWSNRVMLRLLIVNILDREEKNMDEQITTLASLTIDGKGSYGIGASAVPFSKDLYTYLRITDIKDDGTLNLQDLKSVDDEKASEYLLKPNDIVFARTGASTGRNYFYDGTDGEFVYAGFLIKFSIDKKKVNPKYIKYFCQSKQYKDWINSFNTGSTRGNINAQILGKMPIPLIERKTQDALVCILSSIDEKIKKNNEINNNLEQQAMALFKSWFIDFEPFDRQVPKTWINGVLGDFVEIKRGGSPRPIQNFLSDSGFHWLKISDATGISSPFINEIKEYIIEAGLKKTVYLKSGSLVLSNSATPGLPKILDIDTCIHDGWLYFPSSKFSNEYLYLYFKHIRDNLIALGNGSVFTNLKTDILKNYPTYLPTEDVLKKFDGLVQPIFSMILSKTREIKRLAEIRDTLLHKLMSGELDISGIEL